MIDEGEEGEEYEEGHLLYLAIIAFTRTTVALRGSTMQCNARQRNAMQHITTQRRTIQYNAIRR